MRTGSGGTRGRVIYVEENSGLRLRSELVAAGVTDGELRRGRRCGELVRLRRGAYLSAGDPAVETRNPEARHALLIAATLGHLSPDAVVSHASAAVLYGLPVWGVSLARVHVTRARPTGARAGAAAVVHSAPLTATEVRTRAGRSLTSPARTVADVARTCSFEAAVAMADAALHRELVTTDDLATAMMRVLGWRGAPAARRVVAFADERSESVGESRSRVALRRAGIPDPVAQWEVRHRGILLGRVDFAWPDAHVVAEFDGRIKYGRSLRPGEDAGDAVYREKRREDRLRAAGLTVVRWNWDDLATFAEPAARLRLALACP